MKNGRVSFVITSTVLGGGELFTIRLAQSLKAYVPVRIVGLPGSPVLIEAQKTGLDVFELNLGSKLSRRTMLTNSLRFHRSRSTLDGFIRRFPNDLIVLQYKWEELLWAGRHSRHRVVLWEHGPIPKLLLGIPWARKRLKAALESAQSVFAISEPARESIHSLTGRGVGALEAGIDTDRAQEAVSRRRATRGDLGVNADAPLIAFVGRVTADKGIFECVRLMGGLEGSTLVVCGDGPAVEAASRLASEIGVDDRVKWLGWRDDALDILAASDVLLVLSSSPGEGRPLVVLESLSVGTPVVGLETSHALRAMQPVSELDLVPAGDAHALEIATHKALARGRRVLELMSWNSSAQKFFGEIEPLLASLNADRAESAVLSQSGWRSSIHAFGSVLLMSTADFNAPLWTNKQHVAVRLAQEVPVVYVESLGLRTPRISRRDFSRVFSRLRRLMANRSREHDGGSPPPELLEIAAPIVLPFHRFRIVRAMNKRLFRLQMHNRIAQMPAPVLLWAYSPLSVELLDTDQFASVLFHCVDDLSTVPGIPAEIVSDLESDLASVADAVVVTAPPLHSRFSKLNSNTRLIHNVVDIAHFSPPDSLPKPPDEFESIPAPRALFVGALSDHKIDWELVAGLSELRPDWSLVFIGPEGEESRQSWHSVAAGRENIHLLGRRAYDRIPEYCWAADVGIIPYLITDHTKSVFPMKALEYRAAGLNVIATPLPGLLAARQDGLTLSIASTAAEFSANMEIENRDDDVAYLKSHTWDALLDGVLGQIPAIPSMISSAVHQPSSETDAK